MYEELTSASLYANAVFAAQGPAGLFGLWSQQVDMQVNEIMQNETWIPGAKSVLTQLA